MKKFTSIAILIAMLCILSACGENENKTSNTSLPETQTTTALETTTENITSTTVAETEKAEESELQKILQIKTQTVRNDKTGNWRYSAFSEKDIDFVNYSLDYYKEYFGSDNEIHAVVNFASQTTTRISYTRGVLYVTPLEYVKGEEHDADLMFSGNVIKDYMVYTDSGEIEEIT
ncbi:MAG: hypothetical protein K2J79_10345, partial [Ruminiclostridium sp.]|nr:hypothetical protein [Ruminiclostridium sp.]